MSDATLFDGAVARLRGLSEDVRSAAGDADGFVPVQMVHVWTRSLDSAIADLLEVQRRAGYAEVFAVGAALIDVMAERPAEPADASAGVQPSMDFGLFPAA